MKVKSYIAALLSVVLCLPASVSFADAGGHWADASINRMTELGYVQGNESGDFMPDDFITRAELCTILNRVTKLRKISGMDFVDVTDDDWFKTEIDKSVTAGYIAGYEDGSIRGNNYITRAEAAVLISRVFENDNFEEKTFSDSAQIGDWAKEAVNMLSSSGLINGYEDNSFRPDNKITRAEAVTILDKAVGDTISNRATYENLTFDKNLILTSGGSRFVNTTINGNVYITPAANSGEIRFENCNITGSVYSSGDYGAIILQNSKLNTISVGGNELTEIILSGNSSINSITARGKAKITDIDYLGGKIGKINAKADTEIGIDTEYVGVNDTARVDIDSGVHVDKMEIGKDLLNVKVNIGGKVGTLTSGSRAEINGLEVNSGYNSQNVSNTSEGGSENYIKPSTGGTGGGGGGGGGKATSGSSKDDIVEYRLLSLNGYDCDFKKLSLKEYSVNIPFDVDSFTLKAECTAGAKIAINDENVGSGEMKLIENVPQGKSNVKIELFDGLELLDTWTVSVYRLIEATEEEMDALNLAFKQTQDAEADAPILLSALTNAHIDGAIVILCPQYKEAYDKISGLGNVSQKEFISMISDVNEANAELLAKAVGIKENEGYVYSQNITIPDGGMYEVSVKYAATEAHDQSAIAIYSGGKRYESEIIDINPSDGWVETKVVTALYTGKNALEIYAETAADGNYGIIVEKMKLASDKLELEPINIIVDDMEYKFTEINLDDGTWQHAYDQHNANFDDIHAVGGGGVTLRFNSPTEQAVYVTLNCYRSNPNTDPIVVFHNPIATPNLFDEKMVEGVDYPSIEDAVLVDTTWTNGNKQMIGLRFRVMATEGENVLWLPGRALVRNTGDGRTTECMYLINPALSSSYANRSLSLCSIDLEPIDYAVTPIKK